MPGWESAASFSAPTREASTTRTAGTGRRGWILAGRTPVSSWRGCGARWTPRSASAPSTGTSSSTESTGTRAPSGGGASNRRGGARHRRSGDRPDHSAGGEPGDQRRESPAADLEPGTVLEPDLPLASRQGKHLTDGVQIDDRRAGDPEEERRIQSSFQVCQGRLHPVVVLRGLYLRQAPLRSEIKNILSGNHAIPGASLCQEARRIGSRGDPLPAERLLLPGGRGPPHPVHGLLQSGAADRLEKVIDRLELERVHRVLVEGGAEDDPRPGRGEGGGHLHPRAARHLDVEEDQIGLETEDRLDRLLAVFGFAHYFELVEGGEQLAETVARGLFVIHHKSANRPSAHRTRATTTVMSSCWGVVPRKRSTSLTIRSRSSAAGRSGCRRTSASSRVSPNSSSAPFLASVTPSVKASRMSPGVSASVSFRYCASARSPTTVPPDSRRRSRKTPSAEVSRRKRSGGLCPALT